MPAESLTPFCPLSDISTYGPFLATSAGDFNHQVSRLCFATPPLSPPSFLNGQCVSNASDAGLVLARQQRTRHFRSSDAPSESRARTAVAVTRVDRKRESSRSHDQISAIGFSGARRSARDRHYSRCYRGPSTEPQEVDDGSASRTPRPLRRSCSAQ